MRANCSRNKSIFQHLAALRNFMNLQIAQLKPLDKLSKKIFSYNFCIIFVVEARPLVTHERQGPSLTGAASASTEAASTSTEAASTGPGLDGSGLNLDGSGLDRSVYRHPPQCPSMARTEATAIIPRVA